MSGDLHLERELSQVPVTALAFYHGPSGRRLVLAAQDNSIEVYNADTTRLLYRFCVFDEQLIHGFRIFPDQGSASSPGKILAWGGKLIAIFSTEALDSESIPTLASATAPDWIYDSALSPFDTSLACLATAHNEVVLLRHDENTNTIHIGEIVSPARPMLYTAQVTWLTSDCVLVAAGTAFGEILVWKSWIGCAERAERGPSHQLLSILTGHEGSIFGVDISPVFTALNGDKVRFLATCSDDRTVRIWDITEREEHDAHTYAKDHLSAARETGFGGTDDDTAAQSAVESSVPVAMSMGGHISRIWGVKFSTLGLEQRGDDNVLEVYTFGEDVTTQAWRMTFRPDESGSTAASWTGKLTHHGTFSLHGGKHLWGRAISAWDDRQYIVTGGADSRISLMEAHVTEKPGELGDSPSTTSAPQPNELVMVDVEGLCSEPASSTRNADVVGQFAHISANELMVATRTGNLLIGSGAGADKDWKLVPSDDAAPRDDIKRTYVLEKAADRVAVLGTTNGHLYLYNNAIGRLFPVHHFPRKIAGISCLSAHTREVAGHEFFVEILVHLFGMSNPIWLTVSATTGQVQSEITVSGVESRFITTSASKVGSFLVIGSRHGWISVLGPSEGGYTFLNAQDPRSPDAISSIVPLPRKEDSLEPHRFVTTSRDGKYRIFEIIHTSSCTNLELLHESTAPLGPMIEGAWLTDGPKPELILYGFRSSSFVVWNETAREERAVVNCGGAHRTFSFHPGSSDHDPLSFSFTKSSKLYTFHQTRLTHSPLKTGTHGREIRCITSAHGLTATGSEDTTIRIWGKPGDESYPISTQTHCLAVMKAHLSGIQKLQWSPPPDKGSQPKGSVDCHLFSSGGNEEFMVWRVRSLKSGDYSRVGVTCEAVLEDKTPDEDLRIMDFDIKRGETDGAFVITMAFSNSTLSTYTYSRDTGFQLLAKGSYTGACITQVRVLSPCQGEKSDGVLTASTDGHLATWKQQSQENQQGTRWRLNTAVRIHQSSIKSLALAAAGPSGQHRVYTGGDDNALAITNLSSDDHLLHPQQIVREAHAAAINGIALVDEQPSSTLFTASNDQRLKVWKVEEEEEEEEGLISLQGNVNSGVADPSDIELLSSRPNARVVIAGVGTEIWRES